MFYLLIRLRFSFNVMFSSNFGENGLIWNDEFNEHFFFTCVSFSA